MTPDIRFQLRAADVAPIFDGSRLTLARQAAGFRKSDVARLLGKSPTAVAAFESDAKRPSAATVAQLALKLQVEPGFFVGREPVTMTTAPHFRSLRSTNQLIRDQAAAYGQLAVDIAAGLERYVEFPDTDVPDFPVTPDEHDESGPEHAAQLLRKEWGLGAGPVGHLVRLAENHGILVVFSPAQSASVDAYSFGSRLRPVIVLNPVKNDYYRQRFDIAHEIGHLIMHGDAEPGGQIVEDQAHRFAAELLMPADQIRELLPTAMGGNAWSVLSQLKEQWGVSLQALLYRSRHLGRLSEVSYRNAMATISTRGWRRREPGLVTIIEQPSLMPRAVELLHREGVDSDELITQCSVPRHLFGTITSRTPDARAEEHQGNTALATGRASNVVSLFQDPDKDIDDQHIAPPG